MVNFVNEEKLDFLVLLLVVVVVLIKIKTMYQRLIWDPITRGTNYQLFLYTTGIRI